MLGLTGTEALSTTVGGYFREGLPAFRPGTARFMVRVDTNRISSLAWTERAREALEALDNPALSLSITPPRIRGVETRLADADLITVLTREDNDLLALAETENQILEKLQSVPGLTGVRRLRAGVSPRWVVEPDLERLSYYGSDAEALRHSLEYALDGRRLRERMHRGEPLVLRARYDRRFAGGVKANG